MFHSKTQRISFLVVSLMVLSVVSPVLGWTKVNWSFWYSPSSPIINEQVTFTTSCYYTPPCTYGWTFGDGSSSTNGPTVYHTYSSVGSYTVTVTGQDSQDTAGSSSQTIQVTYCQASTAFSYTPSSPLVGQTVTFTANIAPYSPCSIGWSFGDGTGDSSNSQVVHHAYLAAGAYTVTLHATNYNGNVLPPVSQALSATCGTLASGTAIPVSGNAVNPIVNNAFTSSLGYVTSDAKVDSAEATSCPGTLYGGTKPGIYIGAETSLTSSARKITYDSSVGTDSLYNIQYLKVSAKITNSTGTVFNPNPTTGPGGVTTSVWDSPHDTTAQDTLNVISDIVVWLEGSISSLPLPPTIRNIQSVSQGWSYGADGSIKANYTQYADNYYGFYQNFTDKALKLEIVPAFFKPDVYTIAITITSSRGWCTWDPSAPQNSLCAGQETMTQTYSFNYVYENDGGKGGDAGNTLASALGLGSVQLPATYNGFLYGADNADAYSFYIGATETVSITVTPPASANFAISLYDQQQNPMAGSSFTATPGTYFAIISVVSGSGQYSFTLSLIPPGDFGLSANPTSLNIYQTMSGSSTITLSSIRGYSRAVTVSAASNATVNGAPALYWSFTGCTTNDCTTTPTVPSGGTATTTITIWAFSNTPTQTFIVTVTGTDSTGLTHSVNISVTVQAYTISGGGGGCSPRPVQSSTKTTPNGGPHPC